MPSALPLIPTPIEKNINKNESVTVTHFSDLHGGVVEKISVPVTSGNSSFLDADHRKSPKMEFSTTRTSISNNPFADEILTTSKTIISTSAAVTSPTVKISTNNPFHSSFNGNDSNSSDKSLKISFSILGTKNPFESDNHHHVEESNGELDAQNNNNIHNNNSNNSSINDNNNDDMSIDDVDNETKNNSSISSVSLKIDNNNDNNVTMIKMESNDKKQTNGEINTTAKKVKTQIIIK